MASSYGGLFSDIPPTKKKDQAQEQGPYQQQETAKGKQAGNTEIRLPPSKKSKLINPTMAFIPAAARKRKRKKTKPKSSSSVTTGIPKNEQSSTTISEEVILAATKSVALTEESTSLRNDAPVAITKPSSECQVAIKMEPAMETERRKDEKEASKDHGAQIAADEDTSSGVDVSTYDGSAPINMEDSPFSLSVTQQTQQQPELAEPSPSSFVMTIKDPYDPFVPNDLLEYRERLAVLERQEKLRKQLESQRRELLERRSTQSATRTGGRGRGLSNLPAWMVAQQQQNVPSGLAGPKR